jgi:hypothetical protein
MENIKFRVWDRSRKVMYKDISLDRAYLGLKPGICLF